jgi:hypothetical protein
VAGEDRGMILAVIGTMLIYVERTATVNRPIAGLRISAAASLVIVEIVYVLTPIYLGDALVKIALIIWWVVALLVA